MTRACDIMTGGPACIGEHETLMDAAKKMQQLDVGALPICGDDNKLKGMLTDRDIVIKGLAAGKDPSATTASELSQGVPCYIDADASVDEAVQVMMDRKIRRLPVIKDHKLIGIISQAGIATNLDETKVGDFLRTISAAP